MRRRGHSRNHDSGRCDARRSWSESRRRDADGHARRGGASPDAGTPADAPLDGAGTSPDAGTPTDTGDGGGASSDAGTPEDATDSTDVDPDRGPASPDAGTSGVTYRSSLSVCWTDVNCNRALAIGHGGLWDLLTAPYDSDAAIAAAYAGGFDGVKVDVRITADGIPVIAHSSPIEFYESVDCVGQRIEEMTADEVTACHRFPSSTETFQRLDDVLLYLRGKMVVQLTVKESGDYPGTIADVLAANAQDFAFFEISTSDLQTLIPTIAGSDSVYYLIDIGADLTQVDVLLDDIRNPRAFMYEMDPSDAIGALVSTRLHAAGVRSFTYDSSLGASVDHLEGLYDQGFDVVSSQAADNGVTARIHVNQARGVSPP